MSDELAREHVETLLAAAQELTEACSLIAKQLRGRRWAQPAGAGTDPVAAHAAELLDDTAGSTADTRRLLQATLRVLDGENAATATSASRNGASRNGASRNGESNGHARLATLVGAGEDSGRRAEADAGHTAAPDADHGAVGYDGYGDREESRYEPPRYEEAPSHASRYDQDEDGVSYDAADYDQDEDEDADGTGYAEDEGADGTGYAEDDYRGGHDRDGYDRDDYQGGHDRDDYDRDDYQGGYDEDDDPVAATGAGESERDRVGADELRLPAATPTPPPALRLPYPPPPALDPAADYSTVGSATGSRRWSGDNDSWSPPYGGSMPSTGGSSASYTTKGRHSVDETGAWQFRSSGRSGGRHAASADDGDDAGDDPAGDPAGHDTGHHPPAPGGYGGAAATAAHWSPAPGTPAAFIPAGRSSRRITPPEPTKLGVTVRQVEASRRHLQAALLALRDALGADGDVSLLALVERSLSTVTAAADQLREALEPERAETLLPGEARFCCSMPWDGSALVSSSVATVPATVPGATRILVALGYDAQVSSTVDGQPQISLTGSSFRCRVALQQLRVAGNGEWQLYLDWSDPMRQSRSEAETLGPAELTDDEVARRIDDALRRRLS